MSDTYATAAVYSKLLVKLLLGCILTALLVGVGISVDQWINYTGYAMEVTYEDHEDIRLARETWAMWAHGMLEVRVRPYYSRAGPKDTGRFNKSPLEALQGRIDGGMFESQHIEGGNKGNMW